MPWVLACSSNTVPWIIQCLQLCKTLMWSHMHCYTITEKCCQKCLIPRFPLKANCTRHLEEINTYWHVIASVTTGVATGSRRVKPKDVRDRVSEASWAVLLGHQCDSVILSALVVVIFKVSWSVALCAAHTHMQTLGKYLVLSSCWESFLSFGEKRGIWKHAEFLLCPQNKMSGDPAIMQHSYSRY